MTREFATVGKTFEPWCFGEGEAPVVPLFDYGDSMTKVASSLDSVPQLQEFINSARPEEGTYTVLIHANGSDEVWGPNKKGDSFPLEWLNPKTAEYGYRTFEKKAFGYVHHRNTPDRWTGRVLMAGYNDPMGRVELIVKFYIQRLIEEAAPYFAEMLQRGELPAVSMGCRVPYDICSICGSKAPNPMQYCDHLKFSRLDTLPDGRRVRMYNPFPVFHDISLVSSPADPAARVLLKVASDEKVSDMEKRVQAQPAGAVRRIGPNEYAASLSTMQMANGDTVLNPDIDLATLLRVAQRDKHGSYSALTGLGILLRPHEYATIEFARRGNYTKAAEIYAARAEFPVYDIEVRDWHPTTPDPDTVRDLSGWVNDRSIYVPCFEERGINPKTASLHPGSRDYSLPEWVHFAYSGYRKTAEDHLLNGSAARFAYSRPEILTKLLGSDMSVVVKHASLDEPREVFAHLVRGAYLPTSPKP